MNKFINRKIELQYLDEMYQKANNTAQFLIIYGKRRVGKTELIKYFFKDKSHIYFLASKGSALDQLQTATEVFANGFNDLIINKNSFQNWRQLFEYIASKSKDIDKPIIIVFDEFPYLVESDSAISSYFQYGWDEKLKNHKVMLILMGSSISMMYKHALQYNAPIYGRRTGQYLLEPFSFKQSKLFYQDAEFDKVFPLYSLVGGIPIYLKEMDSKKSFKDNIIFSFLKKGSFLSIEPELLLAEEFSEPRTYLSILKAIGLGRTKYSEILNETGMLANKLSIYIKTLIDLRLVRREIPVTDNIPEQSKKGAYSLNDNFLRFYFSFVYPNKSFIESENYTLLFKKYNEVLVQLIAKSYEDATFEFINNVIKLEKLPTFNKLGRWWDKKTEIDLVGLNEDENSILFVETKWNSKPIGINVLNDLKTKSNEVKWGKPKRREHFALVAKGGFSQELISKAKEEKVILIEKDKAI
ncbi:MAG: ATP-binding protein [bacterium]